MLSLPNEANLFHFPLAQSKPSMIVTGQVPQVNLEDDPTWSITLSHSDETDKKTQMSNYGY